MVNLQNVNDVNKNTTAPIERGLLHIEKLISPTFEIWQLNSKTDYTVAGLGD